MTKVRRLFCPYLAQKLISHRGSGEAFMIDLIEGKVEGAKSPFITAIKLFGEKE